MPGEKVVQFKGIGPILFKKNQRAKYLNISLKPFSGIRVTVPRHVTFKDAEEVVHLKAAWIEKHLRRIRKIEQDYRAAIKNLPIIDRQEAREKLTARLDYLARKHGFSYNRVFIRNQKTRWGSCSSKKNINLNMKLLHLPDDLIDFVLLHELVHTRFLNHGKEFWNTLLEIEPNSKTLASRMKQHSLAVL